MRCEEAKRRMIEDDAGSDPELARHLQDCPSCSRAAEAASALNRLLAPEAETEPVMTFSAIRRRVESAGEKQTTPEKIMARIKDQCATRPGLAVGLSLALAILIVASIIPFSYSQTTGWMVSLTGGNNALAASPQVVTAALATAGLDDVSVKTIPDDELKDVYVIDNIPTEKAARAIAEVFAVGGDSSIAVNVKPVVTAQVRPLLAQIYSRVKPEESERLRLRFEDNQLLINGEGISDAIRSADLSDDEVLAEIKKILKNRGINEDDIAISVTSSDNGEVRMVEIQTSAAVVTSIDKPEVVLDTEKRILGLKYKGDIPHVDSGMVVELVAPEIDSSVISTGIILRIAVDKKRTE